jgi:hypothetical protein
MFMRYKRVRERTERVNKKIVQNYFSPLQKLISTCREESVGNNIIINLKKKTVALESNIGFDFMGSSFFFFFFFFLFFKWF